MADLFGRRASGFVLQAVMAPRSQLRATANDSRFLILPYTGGLRQSRAQQAHRTNECLVAAWNSIVRISAQPVSLVASPDLRNRASRLLLPLGAPGKCTAHSPENVLFVFRSTAPSPWPSSAPFSL
jgi:hypothetical protein